jgi:hypothetical protein
MNRLSLLLTSAAVAGFTMLGAPVRAQAPGEGPRAGTDVVLSAFASPGSLQGIVRDDRGDALEGVTVTAIGSIMAFAVTDASGRYALALPPGSYLLRAHRAGFTASSRQYVQVTPQGGTFQAFELRASGSPSDRVPARPILAAGAMAAPLLVEDAETAEGEVTEASELVWRLRHLRRSVLKETQIALAPPAGDEFVPGTLSLLGRAVEGSARFAASLFTEFPLSGEVNLLTTGAVDSAEDLLSGHGLPRGVAYISLGSPVGHHASWAVRAALTEGDVSSWMLAGSYHLGRPAEHGLDIGVSYATQDYKGGNPAALAAVRDGSRNAGTIHAYDDWQMAPGVSVSYGARYARYDYLERENLFSPRAGVTVSPVERTHVSVTVSQRMTAPGAEEFVPPRRGGLWLPPERTFAPIDADGFRVQRSRHVEIGLDREIADTLLIGVRRFYQKVDDQMATFFGLRPPEGFDAELGHYYVATAGHVEAAGWGVRLSRPVAARVRGSIDYSLLQARWAPSVASAHLGAWLSGIPRAEREDVHDLVTMVETEFPETATRVYVVYRVNNAYARTQAEGTIPGFDGRFDVQVNQALPFVPLGGSRWEALLAVRNLFREAGDGSSAYDELLVIRPPKRIVGGVLVRF